MLLTHIDSPRLDLKVKPLYEDSGLALLKSHYYGGIKKYQWPAIPLSMMGVVVLKNGQEIEINIGEGKDDPIFVITDLLPHLDRAATDKTGGSHEIKAEELNIVVGTKPVGDKEVKERIKVAILEWLNKNYKMKEEDFLTADIRFVPSWPARDSGFDRSMVAGYGQDNKAGTFTTLKAFLKAKENETKLVYFSDKEEIGSDGSTGAKSLWLENVLDYLIRQTKASVSIYDIYRKSEAISSDTTGALDPDYKDKQDMLNAVYLGKGVVIEKHLGLGGKYYSVDTEPKFVRKIIDLFEKNNVLWQTGHIGKIDEHRVGGTVAVYLANRNVEILDIGPALLNTHAPYELASKGDIYCAYKGYKVFLED
jgi:aspartyl aminopeptidase